MGGFPSQDRAEQIEPENKSNEEKSCAAEVASITPAKPSEDEFPFEEDLENFVQLCIYRGNKVNAIKMFLKDEEALVAFIKFLNRSDQFYAHFYQDKWRILQEIVKASAEYSQARDGVKQLIGKYIRNKGKFFDAGVLSESTKKTLLSVNNPVPSSSSNKINSKDNSSNALSSPSSKIESKSDEDITTNTTINSDDNNSSNDDNNNKDQDQVFDEMNNATNNDAQSLIDSNAVMVMTAIHVLPKFLVSTQYQNWRDMEAINGYSNFSLPLLQLLESDSHQDDSIKDMMKLTPNTRSTYIQRAFAALDPLEVKNIAKSHYLSTFLGAVEGLPICVSLATASQERRGFPLIYVNSIFEQTTGYSRTEIIGRNCAFLQKDESEGQSIKTLSVALGEAKSVYVTITNYRKNGEKFKNLLAVKPLLDADGVYSYVIGLQFDVSMDKSELQNLTIIDDLLNLLPDRLPRND